MVGRSEVQPDRLLGRWTGGQAGRRMDGWAGGWMDGWMDRRTDGRADRGGEVIGWSNSVAGFMKATVGINQDKSGADGDSWVTFRKRIEILPKKAAK